MIERHVDFGDRGERREDITISAESLIRENHDGQTQKILNEWNEARMRGDLTAYDRCSDARLKTIGRRSISISSVAAAKTPVEKLALDRGIGRWVVLTHIAGNTIKPGEMPRGCGGLAAKGDEGSVDGTEIGPYIKDVVENGDALIQSIRTAERIADISEKPVAAWTIDHLTDEIYPIAYFQKKGKSMLSLSAIKGYEASDYDPRKIYGEGIPTIDSAQLPEEFQLLLEQNEIERNEILSRYPDFRNSQEVQNPRIVFMSTDIRSLKKFPSLSKIPGVGFKVFTNREKLGGDVDITAENLALAFRQLWYAIHHSTVNAADPSKPFSGTDRFVIETPDLALSRKIWDEAIEKPWMQKWSQLQGKMTILLQSNGGRVNDAAEILR